MRPQPDLHKQAEDYELQLPYLTGCPPIRLNGYTT